MAQAEPARPPRGRPLTAKRIAHGAYDALLEALALAYWNKPPFERFVRAKLREHPELLAPLSFAEPKRVVATELVLRLERGEDRYQMLTIDLMRELAGMEDFPNLQRQDDRERLVADAAAAIAALRKWTEQYSELTEAREKLERQREEHRARYEARRSHDRLLADLKQRFLDMHSDTNPQARGRAFQGLLIDLFFLFDLNPRKSFVLASEEIDGAFTFSTDDYLLEAKWEKTLASRAAVDVLAQKVQRKGKTLSVCSSPSPVSPSRP